LDSDDTGYITVQNLRDFLGNDLPTTYLDQIIDEADIVRDHRISYDEFLALWDCQDDLLMRNALIDVSQRRRKKRQESFDDVDEMPTFDVSVANSILPTHRVTSDGSYYFQELAVRRKHENEGKETR
jgi:hypothetical protein